MVLLIDLLPRKIKKVVKIIRNVILFIIILCLTFFLYIVLFNFKYSVPKPNTVKNAPINIQSYPVSLSHNTLKVMTYNMGYASGVKQEALNDPHTEEFFLKNLNQVLESLDNQQIDVLLLQEVDFNSKRTHYFNQLAYLQKELGWNYSAKVSSWKKFVPFMGIGKMNSGVAILSKYPITKHIYRTFIFKPTFPNKFLNFIYFPFVWKNPIQYVTIDYKNTLIHVFNVELEVWTRKYRVIQFDDLMNWIESQGWNKYIIIGGDFNFHAYIPLAGERPQDYLLPPFFYSIWQIIPGIQEAFINYKYTNQEIHKIITFPEFKKHLDFLFFSKEFSKKRSKVFSLKASDHLPAIVELEIKKSP